jgi:hypothetical protein
MANEITVSARLKVAKSSVEMDRNETDTFDMSGTKVGGGIQVVGTTYEAVSLPADIGTAGYAWFKNHSTANYLELGLEVAAAFYAFAKLEPGEFGVIRLATNSIFARANTAACDLETQVASD